MRVITVLILFSLVIWILPDVELPEPIRKYKCLEVKKRQYVRPTLAQRLKKRIRNLLN